MVTQEINITREAEALRQRGFHRAAIYLEDPVIIRGLSLQDILALHALERSLKRRGSQYDSFQFCDREISLEDTLPLLITAAESVREMLPDPESPPMLEDILLTSRMSTVDRCRYDWMAGKQLSGACRVDLHDLLPEAMVANDRYGGELTGAMFFTSLYLHTSLDEFPRERFVDPLNLTAKSITEGEIDLPEETTRRLIKRGIRNYNSEMRRHHLYLACFRRGDPSMEVAPLEERQAVAREISIDLKGYDPSIFGGVPVPSPESIDLTDKRSRSAFRDAMETASHALRYHSPLDSPESLIKYFASARLRGHFKEALAEEPLTYLPSPPERYQEKIDTL